MRSIAWVAVAAGLVLACNDPPPVDPAFTEPPRDLGPEPPATAPAASFGPGVVSGQHRLQVVGQPTWIATLSGSRDGISMSSAGSWPAGTTATLGETTVRVPGEVLRVEPYAAIGDAPVFRLEPGDPTSRPADIAVNAGRLIIRLRNGVEVPVELPPIELPYGIVERAMAHAAENGLTFAGEGAHEGPHSVYVDEPNRSDWVAGPAATVRAINRVARLETSFQPVEGRTCNYIGAGDLPLEIETDVVTVRDRRTGQQTAQQTFTATPTGCPQFALGNRAILGVADQVDAWLTGLP